MPSRLLMTADAVGGVWTYALELARALESHGVETVLAVMGPPPSDDQRREAVRIRSLHLVEGSFALEWMDDPWADVDRAGAWLLDLERRLRPDVVHLNGYVHASLPFTAPVVVVGHSCVLSWWRGTFGQEAPARYATYRRRVAEGLRAADVVVAPTRAFLAELEAIYGPLPLAVAIPNGLSPADPPRPTAKEPFVFAAGRAWDPSKNLAMLARVAPAVGVPVRVAGPPVGPGGQAVPLDGVELLGRLSRDRLLGWLDRAAVFAHPARYEPFGLGPLEAAHAGCALVLSDIPTLREIWRDAAVFVPPGDEAGWATALERVACDPRLARVLGERAACRAARFDVAWQASAYLGVYRHVRCRRPIARERHAVLAGEVLR